jgi:hypothetical protein
MSALFSIISKSLLKDKSEGTPKKRLSAHHTKNNLATRVSFGSLLVGLACLRKGQHCVDNRSNVSSIDQRANHATNLLRAAALLWSFNILVFALWYWEIDGGGPWKGHLAGHRAADFLFPQQAKDEHWAPHFLDYLFVAFTGVTALSPPDTYPLT